MLISILVLKQVKVMIDPVFQSMKKQIKSKLTISPAALMRALLSWLKLHKQMGMKKIWKASMWTGAEAAIMKSVLSHLKLHN